MDLLILENLGHRDFLIESRPPCTEPWCWNASRACLVESAAARQDGCLTPGPPPFILMTNYDCFPILQLPPRETLKGKPSSLLPVFLAFAFGTPPTATVSKF